jgi:phosphate starvation-inducible PhoH-like protein
MSTKTKPFGEPIVNDKAGKPIYAKTNGQHEVNVAMSENDILFVNGSPGTGKTFLALCKAIQMYRDKQVSKIYITRPAVTSEDQGFLPGDLKQKYDAYLGPIYEALDKLIGKKKPAPVMLPAQTPNSKSKKQPMPTSPKPINFQQPAQAIQYEYCLEEYGDIGKNIVIVPVGFIRGRTFENAFVICDESQNLTFDQMKMLVTRLGNNSKMVFCGDVSQSDLGKSRDGVEISGYMKMQDVLFDDKFDNIEGISSVELDYRDIVRSGIVKDIIIKLDRLGYV